jgi:DNA-binding response OmpR family regulator
MSRILVIDDDPMVRKVVVRILLRGGHDVLYAADGDEGLLTFRDQTPDLVITDIIMPGKEGIETIREISSLSPGARIIAMSGGFRQSSFDVLHIAGQLGACKTIAKPFSAAELLALVEHCLQHQPSVA